MSETRVQAATLLCKIFLHYLGQLAQWEGMLDLWTRILQILDRLMHSGAGNSSLNDTLEEAIPESLKNILLVMADGGYLLPPPRPPPPSASPVPDPQYNYDTRTPQQQNLRNETWMKLERFLPNLMPELFPEAAKRPPPKRRSAGSVSEGVKSPVREAAVGPEKEGEKSEVQSKADETREGLETDKGNERKGEGGKSKELKVEGAKVEETKA